MLRKPPPQPTYKLFGLLPPRKQKKPFERWLIKLQRRFSQKTPQQHVAALHGRVMAAFRGELAGLLASTLLAKKTLDTTRQVELPFPDAVFDGGGALDESERATLEAYVKALLEFHERCIDAELPLSYATANGVDVWIASAYALLDPALRPQVTETWQRLSQMGPDLPEATKMLLKREPSDVDRVYFTYRPKAVMG
jgi:hypothetical protein